MEKRTLPGLRRRAPVVNGIFYPDSREALTAQIASYGLKKGVTGNCYTSQPAPGGGRSFGIQAILAPHGAWDLTGNIAGTAFAALQAREEKSSVSRILLFSTHHNSGDEGVFLSESAFFDTPLGELPVDQEMNQQLASCSPHIKLYDIPHLSEHALEVLLPLVKYCFPAAKIVPVLMGGADPVMISGLAKALKIVLGNCMEESLLVISSNISRNSDPETAFSSAKEFSRLIAEMDTPAFITGLAGGAISACGGAIMGALLESKLLHGKHFSSLCPMVQATGENGETVYYGAFVCAPRE